MKYSSNITATPSSPSPVAAEVLAGSRGARCFVAFNALCFPYGRYDLVASGC